MINFKQKLKNKHLSLFIIILLISTLLSASFAINCITNFTGDEVGYLEQTYSIAFNDNLHGWNIRNFFFPVVLSLPVMLFKLLFGTIDEITFIVVVRIIFIFIVNTLMSISIYLFSERILKDKLTYLLAEFFLLLNPYWIYSISYYSIDPPIASLFFLATFFCFYFLKSKNYTNLILSGSIIGIAYLLKYSAGILLIPLFLVLIIWNFNNKIVLIKNMLVMFFSFFSFFILGAIIDYFSWGTFFLSLRNFVRYQLLDKTFLSYTDKTSIFEFFFIIMRTEWILVFALISAISLFLLLRSKFKLAISLLVIILVYIFIMSFAEVRIFRYLWPVIPFFIILSSYFISKQIHFNFLNLKLKKILILAILLFFLIMSLISLKTQFTNKCSFEDCLSFYQNNLSQHIIINSSNSTLLILSPCRIPYFFIEEPFSSEKIFCSEFLFQDINKYLRKDIIVFTRWLTNPACKELVNKYSLNDNYSKIESNFFSSFVRK